MFEATETENAIINYGEEFEKSAEKTLYTKPLQAVIVFSVDDMKYVSHSDVNLSKHKIVEKLGNFIHSIFGNEIFIGRTGSAEFAVFLSNPKSRVDVIDGVDRIISYAKKGFDADKETVSLIVVAGINFIEKAEGEISIHKIIENAEIAMQNARDDDFLSYMIFNDEMERQIERTLGVIREIKENINESKFILKFQPLFDVGAGKLVGFEILSRIYSDKYGIISPKEFVKIAEKNNLICDFDKVILDLAFNDIKKVIDMGVKNIRFSINITPTYAEKPGFIEDVKQAIEKYDMDTSFVAFEFTEDTVFNSYYAIREVMEELNAMGIAVYLDDFGSGFSNFVMLQELKFARIKLDKVLIDKIANDSDNVLVKKVIEIIDALGGKSVAEGIERREQLETLVKLKCDMGQGYYFGKPMSFDQMTNYIDTCQISAAISTEVVY